MNIKTLLLFFVFISSPTTFGNTVLRLGYGYNSINSPAFSSHNTDVKGSNFQINLANRISIIEYGLGFSQGNYSGTLKHDSVNVDFQGKYSRLNLDSKIFFNRYLYVQLGYAINSTKFSLETPVSNYQKNSIFQLYDFKDASQSSDFYYGIGYDIFDTKKFNISLSLLNNKIDEQKSEISAAISLKMSFDMGTKDIFGP